MRHSLWRLVCVGLVVAIVAGAAGRTIELMRFGASDEASIAHVTAELRQRFDQSAATLAEIAEIVAAEGETIRQAPRDQAALKRLFEAIERALPTEEVGRTGITVYDPLDTPLAWAGRVSELPKTELNRASPMFVAPGELGPRLVRVDPVVARDRSASPRLATIVVEQLLGRAVSGPGRTETLVVPTSIVPVSLRMRLGGVSPAVADPYAIIIPSPGGGLLVEADVTPADLAEARAYWRSATWAVVGSILGVTLLCCAGPLVTLRRSTRDLRVFVAGTAMLAAVILAARIVFWFTAAPFLGARPLTSPADLLMNGIVFVLLVSLVIDAFERTRPSRRRPRFLLRASEAARTLAPAFFTVGVIEGCMIWGYLVFLRSVVAQTTLDLLHFSLHPIGATRIALAFGLVLMHAGLIWGAAIVLRLPTMFWRTTGVRWVWTAAVPWLLGIALIVGISRRADAAPPILPLACAAVVAGACAGVLAGLGRRRARRRLQATRMVALLLALLVPALAMYPSLLAFAVGAKEQLVVEEYGPQAAHQREELQVHLRQALDDIELMPSLTGLVSGANNDASPTSDRAFLVWSRTELATYRLTSAVELYAADGRLLSRFALDLPESTVAPHRASGCEWDLFDEASPFGSNERHVLRAARGVCDRGRVIGSIVIRVMLDYRTLPFISSQSPYLESLRLDRGMPAEGASGRDVEFAVYGWSRAPTFASGTSVWALPDPAFEQLTASRTPFWTTLTRDGQSFRVYFLSDRGGIYALGYPVITWIGHLINLAELIVLVSALYLCLVVASTVSSLFTTRSPAGNRSFVGEIRSSFYLKLFLAFGAAAVIPVLVLAAATSAYFSAQLRAGVEETAARTATVAQRLVEDYAAQQQQGPGTVAVLDDQIMVLVRRAIDQDVNLFDRARLQATSERDLFASGLLATRTPGDVYRGIVLDRLPTFVGIEEVGDLKYLLAAAPVRAGGRERIVTVPLTLRQPEIERQIDELDRGVVSAAVLFSLLGAAFGYRMAGRIADPVNRLAHAARRIARGDLEAHIVADSSDELGRLVTGFNGMVDDLKRQRSELERTQRLEAWADIARQVAHDIKNPLTPIQLAAEHARRVNLDRGRPLSPVLDSCVTTILNQVRLLREISAEFSSFASSPVARPEPTRLADLINEVVEPYRSTLADRILIDVEVAPDVPTVVIDHTLFGRALINIIENALHAMPGEGRLTLAVHADTAATPNVVVVEIADSGVGMDEESVEKIFEPYFSTKATGTGLGLTIAKRNIELNGGTIRVNSERGVGTTVTITLPI